MVMSGKTSIADTETTNISGIRQDLDGHVFSLLKDTYMTMIPRYKELCEEYESCLKRAANARTKSTLPSIENWIPSGGLQYGDSDLLHGPVRSCTVYKRIMIEDCNTHRFVTYTSSEGEHDICYSCSHVQIPSQNNDIPLFGRIKMCFTHTFAADTQTFALVYPFSTPQRDSDSDIWFVYGEEICSKAMVVLISDLSYPIVVANNEEKLWFLDAYI